MPNKLRYKLVLFTIFLSITLFSRDMNHVLVLHSYFPNQGWTRLANEGIMSSLHKAKEIPLTLDIRYLDMRSDTSSARLTQIKKELRQEYPNESDIDLLIIVDDLAFEFANKKGDALFPNVPIIFCSAKNYKAVDYGNRPVTGVNESIGLIKNIRLAKQLLPKTKTALLMNSTNLPTGKGHLAEVETLPTEIDGVELRLWKDHTKQSLQDAIEKLPENSILFFGITSFTDDKEMDLIFNLHDFSFFWENTNAPVFSHNFDLIHSGFMGGYTIKAEEIGEATAKMAIDFLNGKPISEMPVKLIYPDHLTLNYNTLKKYNIPLKQINNKSVLVNYNPTFWDLYKNIVITAIIVFFIQLVFIILLLEQKRALRRSQIELKIAKQTAEESSRMKKVFLANMNHEIRTPLNAIIGFSNLLYEENLEESEKVKYLGLINENSENLLNMVGDLLDLSKIESGGLEIYPRNINLNQITKEVYETSNLLRVEQEKTALKFVYLQLENGALKTIYTDPYRLKQILYNLVVNAIKSTDEGEINIGYKIDDKNAVFFVENPGLLLSDKEKERIFEPFYQPLKSYNIFNDNIGTTLSLMHRLAGVLGGKLEIANNSDEKHNKKGSIFYLSIPISQSNNS